MDCKCVSNWPSMGGKLLSGREGKGEVMSLEVAFKGGISLFLGVWVGSSSGKGQRGQRSVYLKNGVCKNGEW